MHAIAEEFDYASEAGMVLPFAKDTDADAQPQTPKWQPPVSLQEARKRMQACSHNRDHQGCQWPYSHLHLYTMLALVPCGAHGPARNRILK